MPYVPNVLKLRVTEQDSTWDALAFRGVIRIIGKKKKDTLTILDLSESAVPSYRKGDKGKTLEERTIGAIERLAATTKKRQHYQNEKKTYLN